MWAFTRNPFKLSTPIPEPTRHLAVESSWNVMAHGVAREGKWRENWRMEWVASTLHTTSEHGVSSITTADAHNSAASSRLNWCPRRFKWTCPFYRKKEISFLRVCHHISSAVYLSSHWIEGCMRAVSLVWTRIWKEKYPSLLRIEPPFSLRPVRSQSLYSVKQPPANRKYSYLAR